MDNERLAHIATEVRKSIIKAVTAAKSGHPRRVAVSYRHSCHTVL